LEQISTVSQEARAKGFGWSDIYRTILLAVFLAGGMLLFRATPLARHVDSESLRQWLHRWGSWAWLGFTIAGFVLASVGFPRIALAALGGAMFGIVTGTILAQIAATLSAIPGFLYTRFVGRKTVVRRAGRRLQQIDALVRDNGFSVMLLIRLCPVGNAFLTSCIAGVTAIPLTTYIAASCLGFLPETFIFALFGAGLTGNFHVKLISSIVLLLLFSLFFLWYFSHSRFGMAVLKSMRQE